jgi:trk system potassium uptake protein TrkH
MMITSILIFIGGFGFITWHEIGKRFITNTYHQHRISWHTKLIIKTFFISLVVFAVLFWMLERNNTLLDTNPLQALINVVLTAFSTKSTGFLTIPVQSMHLATLLLLMVISFIGSAPSSTGSGIKIGIFAIFLAVIRATIEGRSHAEILGRRIARDQVYKAMAIITLALSWIVFITFCLLIVETQWSFIDILFEAVSAFSNSGMSTGITQHLSNISKIFISLSMLLGRVGALALIIGMRKDNTDFSYPEEKVILS